MPELWQENRRTCLAYSPGGHLAELERALDGIEFSDCFHVTFRSERRSRLACRRLYEITHPRRRVLATLRAFIQAFWILMRERPALIVSTGADVAVPVIVLGRLFGARVVFIESGGTVGPTLSGRLVYPLAHMFIVQWPAQREHYPKAILASGPLL